MRCFKSAPDAEPRAALRDFSRGGLRYGVAVLLLMVLAAATAEARSPQRRATPRRASAPPVPPQAVENESSTERAAVPSLRMKDTAIEGERQTPDIFFVVPTGKGGKLRSPYRRDYTSEILDPVVKSWVENDENVHPTPVRITGDQKFDLRKFLRSEPSLPPATSAPIPVPAISRPEARPVLPPQATSGPPAFVPPLRPEPAPPPPPSTTPQLTTPEGIPILVPVQ